MLRTKPHLVAIRPAEGLSAWRPCSSPDEVRDGRELVWGIEGVEVSGRELRMAETLIETLRTGWNPAPTDTYREELLRRMGEKAPIEPPAEAVTPASGSRVEELMQALKTSVEAAKKKKRSPSKRTA